MCVCVFIVFLSIVFIRIHSESTCRTNPRLARETGTIIITLSPTKKRSMNTNMKKKRERERAGGRDERGENIGWWSQMVGNTRKL